MLLLTSCKNSGTEPVPVTPFPGNTLFAGNWGYDQVYIVSLDSNKVIDSLKGFGSVWNLAITNSKSKLYISTRNGPRNYPGACYSVDLANRNIQKIISKSNDIYISPSGIPFIFISTPYDSLRQIGTVDTITGQISIIDTLDIIDAGAVSGTVIFNSTKPVFYTVNNAGYLFAYDYKKKEVIQTFPYAGSHENIVISNDNTKIYATSFAYGLIAFDLTNNTFKTLNKYVNPLGSLALSPDNKLLYITDPGKYLIPEPIPSGKINIFQTSSLSYVGEIDVNKISGKANTITDRITISSDGKKGYVSDFGNNIFELDLEMKAVISRIQFPMRNICIRAMVLYSQ